MSTVLLLLAAALFMGSGSVLTFGVLIARHRRYQERQRASLMAHMARHPAGSRWVLRDPLNPLVDTPITPSWPIRARPCRCELRIPLLDGVEAEYAELIHISDCPIALDLLPNQRGEAA